jgi:ferritin-like metal-binding protein YciE
MPKLTSLSDLLVHELKDLYHAEKQLVKALPRMARAAHDAELRMGFAEHLQQTKHHVERIEQAMKKLGATPRGRTCKAMQGLLEEGGDTIHEDASPEVKDAALIAAAQRVEHYEIAGYGTARTYAELLELEDVVELMQQTLDEEAETDKRLSILAETINLRAESEEERQATGFRGGMLRMENGRR